MWRPGNESSLFDLIVDSKFQTVDEQEISHEESSINSQREIPGSKIFEKGRVSASITTSIPST